MFLSVCVCVSAYLMCVYVCVVWVPVHIVWLPGHMSRSGFWVSCSVISTIFYHLSLGLLLNLKQVGGDLSITYHCPWAGMTSTHTFTPNFLCRYWSQNSTPPTSLASKCSPPLSHLSSPSIISLRPTLRGGKPSPQSRYLKHCSLSFLSFILFWMNWNFCIRLIYWNMNFRT